jgi:hypothetical protein
LACELAEVGGDLGASGEAEEVDGGVAEGGQVLRSVAAADLATVFAVGNVANPMQPVFDVPMSAPAGEQLGGVGPLVRDAGDGELHFDGSLAVADRGPFQAADLSQAGPIEMLRQTRAGLQMPLGVTTVTFVAGANFRQRALSLGLARRGKNRAETRPRSLPSIPAGYL